MKFLGKIFIEEMKIFRKVPQEMKLFGTIGNACNFGYTSSL